MMTIFLGWTAGPSSSNQLSTALSSTRRNNDVCIVIPANAASDYFVIDQWCPSVHFNRLAGHWPIVAGLQPADPWQPSLQRTDLGWILHSASIDYIFNWPRLVVAYVSAYQWRTWFYSPTLSLYRLQLYSQYIRQRRSLTHMKRVRLCNDQCRVSLRGRNFNVAIFSDTVIYDKCQTVHDYSLSFTHSYHFQWPWLYFKVTAVSNSFDWKIYVFILLIEILYDFWLRQIDHEYTTFFFRTCSGEIWQFPRVKKL